MSSRAQRAQLVQSALAERGWTRHTAHKELEISRPAIEKLWDGRDVELEIVERFARGLGLDVNSWRVHWGYEPVVDTNPARVCESLAHLLEAEGAPSPDPDWEPGPEEDLSGWEPDEHLLHPPCSLERSRLAELLGDPAQLSDEELGARFRALLQRAGYPDVTRSDP